jgi:hypothetical protein
MFVVKGFGEVAMTMRFKKSDLLCCHGNRENKRIPDISKKLHFENLKIGVCLQIVTKSVMNRNYY